MYLGSADGIREIRLNCVRTCSVGSGEDPNAGGQRGSGSRRVRHQKIEKIQNQQMWGSRGGNSMEIHRVDLEVANSMEISKCVHI